MFIKQNLVCIHVTGKYWIHLIKFKLRGPLIMTVQDAQMCLNNTYSGTRNKITYTIIIMSRNIERFVKHFNYFNT